MEQLRIYYSVFYNDLTWGTFLRGKKCTCIRWTWILTYWPVYLKDLWGFVSYMYLKPKKFSRRSWWSSWGRNFVTKENISLFTGGIIYQFHQLCPFSALSIKSDITIYTFRFYWKNDIPLMKNLFNTKMTNIYYSTTLYSGPILQMNVSYKSCILS